MVRKYKYLKLSITALFTVALVISVSMPVSAAEQTTWQKFVKQKCSTSSADAAERCAADLQKRLENRCGEPKRNDEYKNCWQKFIRDNGGTAGPNSSPFEEERTPELENNGSASSGSCGDIKTSLVDCDTNGGNPVISLLLQIVNFLAVGVGLAVVGGIIWGGMVYASSNGDSNKVQQAKMIVVNAVLGLILFFFMYALINYLVPGGLFN